MSMIRLIFLLALIAVSVPARAAQDDDDWASFGRVLGVVQTVIRLAAKSDDPVAVQRGIEDMLTGRDAGVNRLFADLFEDVPGEHRGTLLSIGRDLATIAARENAKAEVSRIRTATADRAIAARKELSQTGLRYHDATHFLDAVKRNDLLAVELFVSGRGVNLAARDTTGESAMDIAKRAGNPQLIQLLAATDTK